MRRAALLGIVACNGSRAPEPPPSPPGSAVTRSIDAAVVDAVDVVDAPPDAALAALELSTLDGPYASIRAYCAKKTPDDLADSGTLIQCDTQAMFDGKKRLAAPAPPFDEARIFVIEGLDPHCQLGVRTGKQWYVLHEAVRCLGERAKSTLVSKVTMLELSDWQPGGTPELVLRAVYDQSLEGYSPQDFDRTHFETLIVCGVGPSGVPSCTRELPVKGKNEEIVLRKKPVVTTFEVATLAAPDQITISGDTSTLDKYLITPLAPGTYALRFP